MAGDTAVDDAARLKTLTQKRGQVKGKLTRLKTFIDGYEKGEGSLMQLKVRLEKLNLLYEEFEQVQSEIETLDDTDSQQERETFEDMYYGLAARGETITSHNTIPKSPNTVTDNDPSASHQVQVKLPSINLPVFSGQYEEWMPFADNFKALIHNNDALSDIQRLHYLRSALKGESSQVIQAMELTATNYNVAWKLLEERYQNMKLIINKHVQALFDLPGVERDAGASIRRLLDSALKHIRALNALGEPTDQWSTLLVQLVTSRLSVGLRQDWEIASHPNERPTFDQLVEFLQRRCQALETVTLQPSASHKQPQPAKNAFKINSTHKTFLSAETSKCRLCNGNHLLYECKKLLSQSHEERRDSLKRVGVCLNCLRPGHRVRECRSRGCRVCSGKHNTILHPRTSQPSTSSEEKPATGVNVTKDIQPQNSIVAHMTSTKSVQSSHILLSTALVDVIGPHGKVLKCRALLDCGSQSNFVTESVAQQLGLARTRNHCNVAGLNQSSIEITDATEATIKSTVTSYKTTINVLIVPKITSWLPSRKVNTNMLNFPQHLALADPTFGAPGRIDLLIGQEIFWELLCIGQHKAPGQPVLQKTRLGWIVGGKVEEMEKVTTNVDSTCLLTSTKEINETMQQFWAVEEPIQSTRTMTATALECEEHYKKYTTRGRDGRYTVKIPFRSDPNQLGDSKEIATRRFLNLEKKLARQPETKKMYINFMQEYENLGHMERAEDPPNTPNQPECFLPHHPVLSETSTTTKLRVVFDASAKTTNGMSLNEIQLVGPTVQNDLFSILIKFRLHTFVMTADLEKMYRQVLVHPSQRSLQKIIWREVTSNSLQIYRLKTVTYGTASAAYLATRTLNQLADDEQKIYPEAAAVTREDFYVDDLLTGTHDEAQLIKLQKDLINLLAKGGFNLRKWNTNSQQMLQEENHETTPHSEHREISKNDTAAIKTLGLWWDSKNDTFHYRHYSRNDQVHSNKLTKRVILSEMAKIFDPLGLVAPIVVRAKILLQELWKLKLEWDESLPMQVHTKWHQLLTCLHHLNDVTIPRQITLKTAEGDYELHGFADASERAYGAAIYLRQCDSQGNVKCSLVCAKSRVAPLKTISLPRLELCATVLLTELVHQVKLTSFFKHLQTTLWTDSTVALAWISGEPARWKTFVANRVTTIQASTATYDWKHVSTHHNPADLLSRGARAQALSECEQWWLGPCWLAQSRKQWPIQAARLPVNDLPEERSERALATLHSVCRTQNDTIEEFINNYSSFEKAARILAYCLRFSKNARTKREDRRSNALTVQEGQQAKAIMLKYVQENEFTQELRHLSQHNDSYRPPSNLIALAPFVGKDGLLRVGGRLSAASLCDDAKHQILLPKRHKITERIAREEHLRQLHCGPQALLYSLRQRYWPINGRSLTRKIIRNCVKCFRAKPMQAEQRMGELPEARVNPARSFRHTGVDYCGPFLIRQTKRRGSSATKCYIAVFVCLATKAAHLELVSELTTDAFLAALRRFVARRGICSTIISDNGKNFVGARRELRELRSFLKVEASRITTMASKEGIEWSFIPPYAPHMGGLWEAAVKSLKSHLRRIVGGARLTFEEMTTVLTQIEAVLNSRPLTPMSNDPADLSVLTPAHFLVGGPLNAIPEPSLTHLPESRLSRWQRLQQLTQHFWARWSKEYLCNLQQRNKWKQQKPPLQIGSIVLLREDNAPPLSWPLGRITKLHPGKDHLTRVVSIKTVCGEVKRSIAKVCPLPIEK